MQNAELGTLVVFPVFRETAGKSSHAVIVRLRQRPCYYVPRTKILLSILGTSWLLLLPQRPHVLTCGGGVDAVSKSERERRERSGRTKGTGHANVKCKKAYVTVNVCMTTGGRVWSGISFPCNCIFFLRVLELASDASKQCGLILACFRTRRHATRSRQHAVCQPRNMWNLTLTSIPCRNLGTGSFFGRFCSFSPSLGL